MTGFEALKKGFGCAFLMMFCIIGIVVFITLGVYYLGPPFGVLVSCTIILGLFLSLIFWLSEL
jgi:hypothetical protein